LGANLAVSSVLIALSISKPWYSYYAGSIYLDRMCSVALGGGCWRVAAVGALDEFTSLMICGLLCSILSFTFIELAIFRPYRSKLYGNFVELFGIVGSALVLVVPLYVIVTFPSWSSDLIKSGLPQPQEIYDAGWYAALIAGVVQMVSTNAAFYTLRKPMQEQRAKIHEKPKALRVISSSNTASPQNADQMNPPQAGIQNKPVAEEVTDHERNTITEEELATLIETKIKEAYAKLRKEEEDKGKSLHKKMEEIDVKLKELFAATLTYCVQCGEAIPRGSKFCDKCGAQQP